MFGASIYEFIFIVVIIIALTSTGLWPKVMGALRELRGEAPPEGAAGYGRTDDDLSYRLLGVPTNASWPEIERAYKQKAKKHHPDLGGDEDAMRALNEAYALLKRVRKD